MSKNDVLENDETYNGWTNYPTWVTTLWMDNDEGTYNALRSLVIMAREYEEPDSLMNHVFTEEETILYTLVRLVKNFVEELAFLDEATVRSDLLGWAVEQINFREIAENLLADAE